MTPDRLTEVFQSRTNILTADEAQFLRDCVEIVMLLHDMQGQHTPHGLSALVGYRQAATERADKFIRANAPKTKVNL